MPSSMMSPHLKRNKSFAQVSTAVSSGILLSG